MRTIDSRAALAALLLTATALAAYPASRAEMYKWTDDRGVTHYGDRVPPEYVNRASSVLSRQGVTLQRQDAAPTPEQIRRRDEEAARDREAAKIAAEQRRKELALLNSYTSEQEIDVLKARALKQVEQSIEVARHETAQLEKKRAKAEADKAAAKAPAEKSVREIEMIDKDIARQKVVIETRQKELAQITAKYDSDKARYREVKAKQEELLGRAGVAQGGGPAARKGN